MNAGALKPASYIPRLVDTKLAELLSLFPAVEVTGPMWCGKTWTALAQSNSVVKLANPQTRTLVEADLALGTTGSRPHLIDEWQDVPEIWDYVRYAVDEEPGMRGAFILTGSSTPAKDRVSHSGAGRIARISMHPMTMYESGLSRPSVSLAGLFEGRFDASAVGARLYDYVRPIVCGGWPATISLPDTEAQAYVSNYLDAVLEVTLSKCGVAPALARASARSLARNAGTAAKLSTLAQDVFETDTPSKAEKNQVSDALNAFENIYLIDSVRGWDAPVRSKARLRSREKRYFCDPSLATALLGVSESKLLEDGQLFGLLFESLALRDLSVYAELLPDAPRHPLMYYRDSTGLEVDAIIELVDGRWAAFEIKLGENGVPAGIDALAKLRRKVASNPAARNPEPAFCAVITGAGEFARLDRENDVYVIPLLALAP